MNATVYYVELTKQQIDEINANGWSSEIGRQYLSAKDGKIDETNRHLIQKAATVTDVKSAEKVWCLLQNGHKSWVGGWSVKCHTSFPRSMDVGDIIEWEDGTQERCASVGFEPTSVDLG